MRLIATLFVLATAVAAAPRSAAAQAHPDFSGKWALDVAKSQGDMVPGSSDMTVTQTDNGITVTRATQTPMGMQTTVAKVTFDGKQSANTMAADGNSITFMSSAAWDGATLIITTEGDFGGQKLHQIDRWTLDAEKKVATENTNANIGDQAIMMKLVFNKK